MMLARARSGARHYPRARLGGVWKRDVHLGAIARHLRRWEDSAGFSLQIGNVAGIPRGHVCQNQASHAGADRDGGGFARRRVPCFRSASGFLVGEGRFVDEDVGAERGLDGCVTRTGVASDHEPSSWPCWTHQLRWADHAPVVQRHFDPPVQSTPHRSFGNSELSGALGVESTESLLLDEREAEGRGSYVIRRESDDRVAIAPHAIAGSELAILHWKRNAICTQSLGASEDLGRASGTPEPERLLAALQRHRAQQSHHAEHVIDVHVGEEDVAQGKADRVAHHLPLRPLATVEQERFALADNGERRDPAFDGRSRCGSSEEANREGHGAEYSGGGMRVTRDDSAGTDGRIWGSETRGLWFARQARITVMELDGVPAKSKRKSARSGKERQAARARSRPRPPLPKQSQPAPEEEGDARETRAHVEREGRRARVDHWPRGEPSFGRLRGYQGGHPRFYEVAGQNLVERGIRVNCVAPGPVWTPLNTTAKSNEEVAKFGADTPMKRPAQPEEIAPAYVFFASDADSSYITGEVVTLLGGETTAA